MYTVFVEIKPQGAFKKGKIYMFTKIIQYLKESKAEVKKVSWPTKKTVERFTLLVILISIATAIFLGALDAFFSWILKTFII